MKKLFLGSMALFMFSISVLIFQISCQKSADAQTSNGSNYVLPPATTTTLGGVIIGNGLSVTTNGMLSVTSSSGSQQNKLLFLSGGKDTMPRIGKRFGLQTMMEQMHKSKHCCPCRHVD